MHRHLHPRIVTIAIAAFALLAGGLETTLARAGATATPQDAPSAPSAPEAPPANDEPAADEPGNEPSVPSVSPRLRARARAGSAARNAWQMDVTAGPMRLYVDPESGTPYWYFTYKVVNNTGDDQRFAPKLELVDDEGRITISGQGVPSEIARRLLRQLDNPLIEDQNTILGDILQGEANAKEGLVVFEVTKLGSKELFLYMSNVSSERRGTRDANGVPVELRRHFMIAFQVPGDAMARGSQALDLLDEGKEPNPRWIWR